MLKFPMMGEYTIVIREFFDVAGPYTLTVEGEATEPADPGEDDEDNEEEEEDEENGRSQYLLFFR